MNVTWVFAVVLALAGVATAGPTGDSHGVQKSSEDLQHVWDKFLFLLPGIEYIRILEDYMAHDREFEAAVNYFFSDAFKNTFVKINTMGDVVVLYDFLEEAGMDIYQLMADLLKIVGPLPPNAGAKARNAKKTGGPAGIIADFKAILQVDKITALHEEQLKSSPAFAKFVRYWNSPSFNKLIEKLRGNAQFQEQLKIAKKGGIHINALADLFASMAGLKFPSLEKV